MNRRRTFLFGILTTIALLAVLLIQVDWILRSARAKEQLFSEKARMVLSRTAEAFHDGRVVPSGGELRVAQQDVRRIDSLLDHYMNLYGIRMDYSFEVKPLPPAASFVTAWGSLPGVSATNGYQTCIGDGPGPGNMELKVNFPEKKQYILAEMGIPFLTSAVLILIVLFTSWHAMLALLKEKRIAEQTRDFLNNMTHEFKTPLTNIALAARMIDKDHDERIRRYTGIIREENDKLQRQVHQVLGMTALARGEIVLQKTACDVHALLGQAVDSVRMQIEHRQGSVTMQAGAARHTVEGDPAYLSMAFGGILDNAIKYSSGKPDISVRTESSPGRLSVIIADKGIGIDPEYQDRVFDTYFRVPTGDVHNVKGFGLGLSYTKKIVEMHGGAVSLLSRSGLGTTITITLPYG